MFKTQYDLRERTETPQGSRIAPTYSLSDNNDLKKTGEKDLYQEIQSHAESCDLKIMLTRLEMGHTDMIRQVSYMDITDLPSNLAEAYNMIREATNDFNTLPVEIRKEYNFSAEEYIKDIGSEKWLKLFAKKEDITPEPQPTSTSDPQPEPKGE